MLYLPFDTQLVPFADKCKLETAGCLAEGVQKGFMLFCDESILNLAELLALLRDSVST